MKPAADRLHDALQDITVHDIGVPVISNADAVPYPSKDEIKHILVKQVDHPVRWEESMRELIKRGIKTAIEIGPGKVLAGLMRRITKEIKTVNLGNPEDLKGLS